MPHGGLHPKLRRPVRGRAINRANNRANIPVTTGAGAATVPAVPAVPATPALPAAPIRRPRVAARRRRGRRIV